MSKRLRLFAGVLTVFLLALAPAVVPVGIFTAPAFATPALTVSPLTNVPRNAAHTFSVTPINELPDFSYNVVMSVAAGTLQVNPQGGSALFGYPAVSGGFITAREIGLTGTRAQLTVALGSLRWTAPDSFASFQFDITVTQAAGADTFFWAGDGTANSARYYRYVAQPGISWTDAEAQARHPDRSLGGIRGYLVRPSTHAENHFIANNVNANDIWIGARRGSASSAGEGQEWWWPEDNNGEVKTRPIEENGVKFYDENWQPSWDVTRSRGGFPPQSKLLSGTTGTPWADGEPNNWENNERYAATNYRGVKGRWNDFQNSGDSGVRGYVIEFNAHATTFVTRSATQTFITAAVPDQVAGLTATSGVGNLTLNWVAPADNNSAITSYTYEYATSEDFTGTPRATVITPSAATSVITPELTVDQDYFVRMSANSALGAGPWSSTASVRLVKAAQEITFPPAPTGFVSNSTYTPAATTSRPGLLVSFTITLGDDTVCSLSGGEVTFLTSGTCEIAADQAGDSNVAAAPRVTQEVKAGLRSQAIGFDVLTDRTYGDAAFTVAASSQLPVAFGSSTTSVCTVATRSVTFVSAGTCTITASQAGDSSFAAASPVSRSFEVAKKPITMMVDIANRQWNDTNTATVVGIPTLLGVLGADENFMAVDVAKVTALFDTADVGNGKAVTVTLDAEVLTAGLSGDHSDRYVVTVLEPPTANITKATQSDLTISVGNDALVFGGTATLSSTGGSGLGAVVFSVASGDCAITGTTVTASGGTDNCVVTAIKGTDSNYLAISAASNLLITVSKAAQSALSIAVNGGVSAALTFGDSATLSSTGGSGTGTVLFTVVSGDCAITARTTVTASGGTTDCVVRAVKQADRNHLQLSATSTVVIVVSKATQSLTFTSSMPMSVVVGARHTPVAVTSAGSSTPVSVTAGDRAVCPLSGGVVVFVGAGSCVVTASQAGTRNFAAAASVSHTIVVREAPVSVPLVPSPSTNPVSPAPVITAPIAPTAPTTPKVQPALLGPVMTPGRGVDMNAGSQATIGGVPIRVIIAPNNSAGATVQAGALRLGITPANPSATAGASFASTGPGRSLELNVPAGQSTTMAGGGLLPGSTLQLWLPGQGAGVGAASSSRELARLSVAADGSFRGDVAFTANRSEVPLPIGRQVMQATGFDENGNQVVVDVVINIAQGAPQPERIRLTDDLPVMAAGQHLATSAGVAETVAIQVRAERGEVAVVSELWQFLLTVSANTGTVASSGGGAVVEVMQSDVATVSGSGFQPETRVDMWLFSEPTLLGSVVVAADGTFTTEFSLDARFATVGAHTLQLQGVGVDGFVKAANLGVSVVDGDAAGAGANAFAGWWMWVLAVGALMAALTLAIVFARRRRAAGRLQGDVASWGTRVVGALRL